MGIFHSHRSIIGNTRYTSFIGIFITDEDAHGSCSWPRAIAIIFMFKRDPIVCVTRFIKILKEYEASYPISSWITMALAYVLVNTELGQEKEVLVRLRELPAVRDLYEVYGVYDIVLKVEADSRKAFQQTINAIRRVAGVRSTLTMIVTS